MDIQHISELVEILDQEKSLYNDVLKISKEKTSIIVSGKVNELESIVKLEQSLILKLSSLEMAREQLIEKICLQLGLESSKITLSELLKVLNADQAAKLKNCQEHLTDVIKDVRNSNELNSKLIKNSLDFINFSVNLLANVDSTSNSYGSNGQTSESKKRNMFDMKL